MLRYHNGMTSIDYYFLLTVPPGMKQGITGMEHPLDVQNGRCTDGLVDAKEDWVDAYKATNSLSYNII